MADKEPTSKLPPGYMRILAAGVALNVARGMGMFVGAYALSVNSTSPLLAELGGALYFLPMLGGGVYRRIPLLTLGKTPRNAAVTGCWVAAVLIVFIAGGFQFMNHPTLWTLGFMFILGVGSLINMSIRLPMLHAMVGQGRAQRFMAIEAVSISAGLLFGPAIAGFVIAQGGIASGLLGGSLALTVAAVLLNDGKRKLLEADDVLSSPASSQDLTVLRSNWRLQGVLAITIIMNVCFFAAIPAIPYFAQIRGMGPIQSGWLAAAVGVGSTAGSLLFVVRQARHPVAAFAIGSITGLIALGLFAITSNWVASFVLLCIAGIGQSGFAVQQPVLTLSFVAPRHRMSAMGLLSIAIGTLPAGVLLTRAAELVLAPAASVATACALGALAVPVAARHYWLRASRGEQL